jgi:PAS domain S-box-containing protein
MSRFSTSGKGERSEILYKGLLETTVEGVVFVAPNGQIIEANPVAECILGLKRSEIKSQNYFSSDCQFTYSDGTPMPLDELAWSRALKQKETIQNLEMRVQRADCTVSWVNVNASPIVDEDGTLRGVVETYTDITNLKAIEEDLRLTRKFLELVYSRTPMAYIIWDSQFHVHIWNPQAAKIFGFTEQEANGKHPYDLIIQKRTQPNLDEVWSRLVQGDETVRSVDENVTKDGRTIFCSWMNTPLKDEDGTVLGVLSVVEDVTEAKRLEERLRELTITLSGVGRGECYLTHSLQRCLKIFFDLSNRGVSGLCIVREDPEAIIKNYNIKPEDVFVLSGKPVKGFKAVSELQEIAILIMKFLNAGGGIVLLHGLEYLISRFGFNSVYKMLQEKHFEFLDAGAILLVPVNLETLDTREKGLLLSEMKLL